MKSPGVLSLRTGCITFCVTLCWLPKPIKLLMHTTGIMHHPAHIVLFTLITACFCWTETGVRKRLAIVMVMTALGSGIEVSQMMLSHGHLELADIIDDALGSALGYAVVWVLTRSGPLHRELRPIG